MVAPADAAYADGAASFTDAAFFADRADTGGPRRHRRSAPTPAVRADTGGPRRHRRSAPTPAVRADTGGPRRHRRSAPTPAVRAGRFPSFLPDGAVPLPAAPLPDRSLRTRTGTPLRKA
ncbi:hypothetical protein OHB41_16295 [Streptomyces sp. NBC_01571]|uniref:hypothetical protein n=1 Tax=Streptomyces sp. NBC_01571 TaxID=2975883 RepID=UPI00224CD6ED|nr:hypothetical protein [Streptomyces sp. NBC_01571]MCX4574723.1 hypothetical protein [Streptomyces sp. NBC_01571]